MLGGVATGLASYLGIDVVIVRIAFVVLAFLPFPGFGLLVYGAMLLLVPTAEPGDDVPAWNSDRGVGFYVGIALVGLATFWLLGAGVAAFGGRGSGLLPLLLIGLGIALWVDADRRRAGTRGGAAIATAGYAGPPAWDQTSRWTPGAATAPDAGTAPDAATAPATTTAPATATATAPPPSASGGPSTWDPPAGDAPPPGVDRPAWEQPGGSAGGPPPPAPPTSQAPAWQAPETPPKPRSPLGRVTLGLALLAGGAVWLLDLLGLATASAATVLATALLVLGLGLLVGAVAGRARWLAWIVALLLPVTLVAAAIDDLAIDVGSGVASRVVTLADGDDLAQPIRLGAGELTVDLAAVGDPEGAVLDASLGAGELELRVPEGAGLVGRARVEVGEVRVGDATRSGIGTAWTLDEPAASGQPTFEVDLRVGAGELVITRVPPAELPTDPVAPAGTDPADTTTPEVDR
jgi:phage shock protein PspC (stress-responsive transcriptional regulator)